MRWLYRGVIVIVAVIVVAFVVQKVFGGETVTPHLVSSRPVAQIGGGADAVAVAEDGTILHWLPVSENAHLPTLPVGEPPKAPRVQGPALEQVHVLAATPPALRRYVAATRLGESGVEVELTSGIELIFGNAGQAARKWKAAAAVLADPSVTSLDYVNLLAPGHPTVGGSGHELPPLP
jgi:hypothetical protein